MKRNLENSKEVSLDTKKEKIGDDIVIIDEEILKAKSENRDFNISAKTKILLCEKHTIPVVVDRVLKQIRISNTLMIDPPDLKSDISKLISRVVVESEKLGKKSLSWMYKIGKEVVTFNKDTTTLLSCSTTSGMLSTYFSGHVRYSKKMSAKAPSVADNWASDKILEKVITNNLSNPKNQKEALSRNRLRVGCMQMFGCQYATSFPISVVLWILKREAKLRPNGKLHRFIDPCAGWGDRLAGALIAGGDVVENYTGIDPWEVSNNLCATIAAKLESSVKVEILSKPAQDMSEPWPDSDLCFTSPPYAALECYNVESETSDDNQAWRLCSENKFTSHFIIPMLKNASNSTRRLNGRIIINIGNTKESAKGTQLTKDLVTAAEKEGLELCETF